jgi:cell division protein ZapE
MQIENPLARYERMIRDGGIQDDPAQQDVIRVLDGLWQQYHDEHDKSSWLPFLTRSNKHRSMIRGAYVWGDVGRGKSMLMDLFYDCLPDQGKKRVHFHAFMRDIHERIHGWRQLKPKGNLLELVARDVASGLKVLCLDEMQVHDITDASIVSKLFTLLFERGLLIVTTSNRAPKDLYQGGIQREQFIPFIELLEEKTYVLCLAGEHDYRLRQLQSLDQTYIHPLNECSDNFCAKAYGAMTQNGNSHETIIEVSGRRISFERSCRGVAWTTFDEMCERPLGAADYLEIAEEFDTIILQGIPILSPEKRNEAKRFVTFVDALYEAKVKLICSAAAAPDQLYPSGHGAFEFERTVSRLMEMQSARYLAMPHISK